MPVVIPLLAFGSAYLLVRNSKSQLPPESTEPAPNPTPEEPMPEPVNDEIPWGDDWHWPVPNDAIVSQEFKPSTHLGVDIMYRDAEHFYAPVGTPILAAKDGKIWSHGSTARGMNVVIDHGPPFATFYQHLESVSVVDGEEVIAGQQIGIMGIDPTDAQQVRHLHFAVWYRGNGDKASVDPGPVINTWERTYA